MVTTDEPAFPPEISSSFLEHLDCVEAWRNRVVCRAWRDYVEASLVPQIWLPDVELIFSDPAIDKNYGMDTCLKFRFQRMAEGGEVVFADTIGDGDAETFKERAGRYRLASGARPIVTMSDFAHDILVPGLKVDEAGMEVQLQWRGLFGQFLSAEHMACERFRANLRKQHDNLRVMKAQILAGLLGEMEAFSRVLESAGDAHDEAYRETRAQRLGFHDPGGDARLKHIRHLLSLPNRDGEEDPDDEDDETSEEEWVTEGEDSAEGSDEPAPDES